MPSIKKYRGVWRYTLELEPGPDRKRRQLQRSGFKTKAEAAAALAKAEALAAHGVRLDRSLTYGEWLDQWLASKLTIRERTAEGYRAHARLYLKPAIGHLELTKLRAEHLDAMYAELRNRPNRPGPATLARVHATVRASLNAALKRRHIAFNPALQVELERVQRPVMPVWSISDLKTFLTIQTDDHWHTALCMIALTGLRRGEALRLTWDQVDLDAGLLRVRISKTDAGVRTIALPADTVRRLKALRRAQITDRLELGPTYADHNLVLCWPDGTAPDPEVLNRHFHKLTAAAKLPRIRLHDLRHTHASHALAAGEPLKVVSDRLGHANIQITANLYTKVLDVVAIEAAQRIGALYE